MLPENEEFTDKLFTALFVKPNPDLIRAELESGRISPTDDFSKFLHNPSTSFVLSIFIMKMRELGVSADKLDGFNTIMSMFDETFIAEQEIEKKKLFSIRKRLRTFDKK